MLVVLNINSKEDLGSQKFQESYQSCINKNLTSHTPKVEYGIFYKKFPTNVYNMKKGEAHKAPNTVALASVRCIQSYPKR